MEQKITEDMLQAPCKHEYKKFKHMGMKFMHCAKCENIKIPGLKDEDKLIGNANFENNRRPAAGAMR